MWKPIDTLPDDDSKTLFVAISVRPEYTSDPYCVWKERKDKPTDVQKYGRWPHPFPPTHWMEIEKAPKIQI